MAHTFEKAVKGATKLKLAVPKDKYVEQILIATRTGEAGVAEVFRTLQLRIRDSTWTIVFKSLIVVHLMIRNGQRDVTLSYLSNAPQARLSTSDFTVVQTQGGNIESYSNYLAARAKAYASTKQDHARDDAVRRLRDLSIDRGLLREIEDILLQIRALLKCDGIMHERANAIASQAGLLLLKDLIALYATLNQAVMSVLMHFFELSNVDATRAVKLYELFVKQTGKVIDFLQGVQDSGQYPPRSIPMIKEANSKIIGQLKAHVKDPDFDNIRRQHLTGKSPARVTQAGRQNTTSNQKQAEPVKAPAPDLIDFFESIEQTNQQPQPFVQAQTQPQPPQLDAFSQPPQMMFQATGQPMAYMQPQQTGFPNIQQPQQISTNPWLQPAAQQLPQQMQPQITGMPLQATDQFMQTNGFESYQQGGQPMNLQQQPAQLLAPQGTGQPQSTNPFRQSMMMTGHPLSAGGQLASVSNFAASGITLPDSTQNTLAPLQTQRTGTNPFARSAPSSAAPVRSPSMLQPMVTGSTNPFRQSQFINQQTGRGWQNSGQQGTMGGFEQLQTVPVFPRPGQ